MEAMNNITRTRTREDEEEEEIASQMTGFMSQLPIDITFNILSRLPIKSLSQCRWVCKPWFKIITASHRFAKFQLAWATQNCSPCLTYFERVNQKFYPIAHQVFDDHETSITVTSRRLRSERMFEVVGSCNGLICLSSIRGGKFEPYYVFNPITGDHITLPIPPTSTSSKSYPEIFGFGIDPITSDYKVICFMNTRKVEIYTLGSDGWRIGLSNIPDMYAGMQVVHTVFVNGALHWIVSGKEVKKEGVFIVSFDMYIEQFREIALPLGFVHKPLVSWYCQLDLGALGGYLCFIDANAEDHTEIWVMKSYGVQGSWCKEYVLRKNLFSGYGENQMMADEVIKLKNGELVLAKSMNYYDPQRNVYMSVMTHGMSYQANSERLQPITHAGTLISPKNIDRATKSADK